MRQRQTLVLTLYRDPDTPLDGLHGSLKDVVTGLEVAFSTWDQLHVALETSYAPTQHPPITLEGKHEHR